MAKAKRQAEPTIPARPRARANGRPRKGTEPDWSRFLRRLGKVPSVRQAAAAIGVNRKSAYEKRERDARFRAAWDAVLEDGVDGLVEVAHERATVGAKVNDTRDRPSDELLRMLLRAYRPTTFGLNVQVRGRLALADLRAMSDDDLDQLAIDMGLKPDAGRE